MGSVRLSYLTFLARDVGALAGFYVAGLGLAEVEGSRDARYREVRAGGCMIGFAHESARAAVHMADQTEPSGIRSLATFNVGAVAAVAPAVERAVAAGATLKREALNTVFGQHQAVLTDLEGNAFRISAAVGT